MTINQMPAILATESNPIKKFAITEWFLSKAPESAVDLLVRVVMCIVLFLIGSRIIFLLRKIILKMLGRSNASKEVVQFVDSALKAGLYAFLVVQLAVGLGLDATSIATVFGSAAVAVGLAFQGSLKNCIGGVLILMLRPFSVGDYIIESAFNHEGIVKEITIFYTRLATLDNRTILVPNGLLADTSIINVTGVEKRRLEIKIRIAYSEDIRRVKEILTELLTSNEMVCKDEEILVYADQLAEDAVVMGVRCWIRTGDFWKARCELTEGVKYALDDNGIEIQVPRMEVRVKE